MIHNTFLTVCKVLGNTKFRDHFLIAVFNVFTLNSVRYCITLCYSEIDIPPPCPEGEPPIYWWDDEADKSVLIGVFKHGIPYVIFKMSYVNGQNQNIKSVSLVSLLKLGLIHTVQCVSNNQ